MDGVLVDGEPLHFEAVNQLLAEEGRSLTLDQYRPYMGTKSGWTELISDLGLRFDHDHYAPRYNALILDQYRRRSEPVAGALALVRTLRERRIPLALASSSVAPWVEACLERIGLADAFDVVVTGSDVEHGKPDPEIYLLTADRLGVPAGACLAVEDAPAGVQSAARAGMTCWAVRTPYTIDLDLPGADRIFQHLSDIQPDFILRAAA